MTAKEAAETFMNSASALFNAGAAIVITKLVVGKGAFDNIKNKTREDW